MSRGRTLSKTGGLSNRSSTRENSEGSTPLGTHYIFAKLDLRAGDSSGVPTRRQGAKMGRAPRGVKVPSGSGVPGAKRGLFCFPVFYYGECSQAVLASDKWRILLESPGAEPYDKGNGGGAWSQTVRRRKRKRKTPAIPIR